MKEGTIQKWHHNCNLFCLAWEHLQIYFKPYILLAWETHHAPEQNPKLSTLSTGSSKMLKRALTSRKGRMGQTHLLSITLSWEDVTSADLGRWNGNLKSCQKESSSKTCRIGENDPIAYEALTPINPANIRQKRCDQQAMKQWNP